jgi:hypothetical protein
MQRAGYSEKSCGKLRALGLNHNFYLAHGMQRPEYAKDWRLFYPKGFKSTCVTWIRLPVVMAGSV